LDIYIIGKNIERGYYSCAQNRLYNKISSEEAYGVCVGIYRNNLTEVRKPLLNSCLQMNEGPITVRFDQPNGTLFFSSQNWEYLTNKLKKDEEYCFEISFCYKRVELDI